MNRFVAITIFYPALSQEEYLVFIRKKTDDPVYAGSYVYHFTYLSHGFPSIFRFLPSRSGWRPHAAFFMRIRTTAHKMHPDRAL